MDDKLYGKNGSNPILSNFDTVVSVPGKACLVFVHTSGMEPRLRCACYFLCLQHYQRSHDLTWEAIALDPLDVIGCTRNQLLLFRLGQL
ncbi:hypothetical protein VNO77_30871 [Canavalia gladiata]|uniref:Uncharacterized protein n=1 Tax=Canavalia gladiata TaxID=3824 RepID=A0AAN9KRH8_CANGL